MLVVQILKNKLEKIIKVTATPELKEDREVTILIISCSDNNILW